MERLPVRRSDTSRPSSTGSKWRPPTIIVGTAGLEELDLVGDTGIAPGPRGAAALGETSSGASSSGAALSASAARPCERDDSGRHRGGGAHQQGGSEEAEVEVHSK